MQPSDLIRRVFDRGEADKNKVKKNFEKTKTFK